MLVVIVFVDSWLIARIKAFVSRLSLITDTTDLRDTVATERGVEDPGTTDQRSSVLLGAQEVQVTVVVDAEVDFEVESPAPVPRGGHGGGDQSDLSGSHQFIDRVVARRSSVVIGPNGGRATPGIGSGDSGARGHRGAEYRSDARAARSKPRTQQGRALVHQRSKSMHEMAM